MIDISGASSILSTTHWVSAEWSPAQHVMKERVVSEARENQRMSMRVRLERIMERISTRIHLEVSNSIDLIITTSTMQSGDVRESENEHENRSWS